MKLMPLHVFGPVTSKLQCPFAKPMLATPTHPTWEAVMPKQVQLCNMKRTHNNRRHTAGGPGNADTRCSSLSHHHA